MPLRTWCSRWLSSVGLSWGLVCLPACNTWNRAPAPQPAAAPPVQASAAQHPRGSPYQAWRPYSFTDLVALASSQDEHALPSPRSNYRDPGEIQSGYAVSSIPAKSGEKPKIPRLVRPPAPPPAPLVLALERFLEDQPAEAMKLLQAYRPRDQELLLRLMPLLARVAKGGLLTDQLSASEKETLIHTLQALEIDLRAASPLVLRNEGFCSSVKGFGQVKRSESNQFRPGDPVLIYAEIHNLADRPMKDQFAVRLGSILEIRTADCTVLRTQVVHSAPDLSESPRNDHYAVIRFPIPLDLQPGSYTLRVRIVDQETQREAEKFLPFRITNAS